MKLLDGSDFYSLLGRFDLSSSSESDYLRVDISYDDIHVHPEYNESANYRRSHADVAILKVTEKILFSDYIQPVCLPASTMNVTNIFGVVVGYGVNDPYGPSQQRPTFVKLKSIENWKCLELDDSYHSVVSRKSFCAAHEKFQSIPCKGNI